MYFLLKMVIFQPARLVYQRVQLERSFRLVLRLWRSPWFLRLASRFFCLSKACFLSTFSKDKNLSTGFSQWKEPSPRKERMTSSNGKTLSICRSLKIYCKMGVSPTRRYLESRVPTNFKNSQLSIQKMPGWQLCNVVMLCDF